MTTRYASLQEACELARGGTRSMILCPAHEDGTASLSVIPGNDQPVLITCHAGCTNEQVMEAAGMTWAEVCNELEPDPTEQKTWTPGGDASHIYPYRDAQGTLLYEVLRVPLPGGKKRYFQRHPDETKPHGTAWNLDGVPRTIYRLPQVLEASAAGRTIHIAEGEKCVHALLRVISEGEEATCNSGGAGKWQQEFSEFLRGANVIIYADSDEPGQSHARQVRESLVAVQANVRIMEAPAGTMGTGKAVNDVADHLLMGRTLDQLLETTPESLVEKARTGVDVLDLIKRPRGVTDFVIPSTLAKGERALIVGLEGRGKSTLLRQIAVMVAGGLHPFLGTRSEPKRVLFIDAENHPDQTLTSWQDLVGLAARHSSPIEGGMLTVLEEYESNRNLAGGEGAAWLVERINAYRPDLVCMGPLTNLADKDLRDDEPVRRMRNAINEARSVCNSAFIMEHHAPLRGSQDKVREVRPYGSSLFLKWPDYGFAMQPVEGKTDVMEWKANRGKRVRSRVWPSYLREGTPNTDEWPWVDHME